MSELDAKAPVAPIPVKKREIFGWAMYDFANSSYVTVVITVLYGPFFVEQIVPAASEMRDTYWSLAMVASTIVVHSPAGITGPQDTEIK